MCVALERGTRRWRRAARVPGRLPREGSQVRDNGAAARIRAVGQRRFRGRLRGRGQCAGRGEAGAVNKKKPAIEQGIASLGAPMRQGHVCLLKPYIALRSLGRSRARLSLTVSGRMGLPAPCRQACASGCSAASRPLLRSCHQCYPRWALEPPLRSGAALVRRVMRSGDWVTITLRGKVQIAHASTRSRSLRACCTA